MSLNSPATSLQRLRFRRGLSVLLLWVLLLQALTVSACVTHELGELGFSPYTSLADAQAGDETLVAQAAAPVRDTDARLQHAIGSCAHCACSHLAALPVQAVTTSVSAPSSFSSFLPVLHASGLLEQALRPPAAV